MNKTENKPKLKNIILCADGTGNKGGYTPDSNVYKTFNAIDLQDTNPVQIAFYDNGVGTQTNKFIRSLSGAFGFGFQTNVCDLYEYLARNYNPDDNIYMFGFSRGAATIRAFNGFIDACGLIDGRGKSNKDLKDEVKRVMKIYEKKPEHREKLLELTNIKFHKQKPGIAFIGVWDTVSALGFPERTSRHGFFLRILSIAFEFLGTISDKIFPHKFYNYELTSNVDQAYQALSIDDERTSFWPKVWQEKSEAAKKVQQVEQVWFAGMHSNIGGGYERAGLANVSLKWMLDKVEGIKFKDGFLASAKTDANVNGRLYDSRHGFGAYYRYHPRAISTLCEEAGATVKIHESVIRRLKRRTANYAPTSLPENFEVVDNKGKPTHSPVVHGVHWKLFHKGINRYIGLRKWLYGISLELTLGVLIIAGYFWINPPTSVSEAKIPTGLKKHVTDILEYFSPEYFDELINMAVIRHPQYAIAAIIILIGYLIIRKIARKRTTCYAECLRKLFIISPEGHPDYPEVKDNVNNEK